MKHGQITIFMIIGIIILLGAGMLIYMTMIKPEKSGEEKVAAQALRQAAVQPIKDYITSCLDITSADALEFVGKQGGRLYVSQGGTIPDPATAQLGIVFLNYDELRLSYSVVPPQGSVGDLFFSEPPKLDWPVTIKEKASSAEITLDKFRVTHPLAFGRIYYTVKGIVDTEVSNISYEPETTDAYFITINKNAYDKDDVIIYQDKKYNLNARPYEFRIARKNRLPALYKIDQFEIDKFAYCVDAVRFSIDGKKLRASPDLEDGDPFPLNITVVDPDNDAIKLRLDPRNPKVDEYAVALYADNPSKGGLIFKVIASDDELEDYQKIRIIPKGCEAD